jgi:uncharacterized protein (TIGR02145 family)
LPTDKEWNILEHFLGMSKLEINEEGNRTSGALGKVMKSSSGWKYSLNGDNRSGFNVLPAGSRRSYGGFFDNGSDADFWTITSNGTSDAWRRYFINTSDGIGRFYNYKRNGFSVRCLRD